MKYLLDTHVFIWWIEGSQNLPVDIRSVLDDYANTLYLSSASTWEMAIKSASGKLDLPDKPEPYLSGLLKMVGVIPLPITIEHSIRTLSLPLIHKDPFDRLLVSQALCENLTILTADALIRKYDVKTYW